MGHLHRLAFVSCVARPGEQEFLDGLAAILSESRRNNGLTGLTSAIAVHGNCIALILEGSRAAVDAVFDRIRRDLRNSDIEILSRDAADERAFPGESMILAGHSEGGRRALDRLASRSGGSLTGVDSQALLATLREIVANERTSTRSDVSNDRLPDQRWPADAPPPVRLDVGRLRSELTAARPSAEVVGHAIPNAEDEAFENLLAVAVFSAEGVALRANANYCTLLGRTAGAIAGLHYEALIAPGDADRLRRLWAAMATGKTITLHHRALRADGAEMWLESTFRPRLDGDSRLLDVVEIAADHTDKQLQHADDRGQIQAMNTSQAVIHLGLDGTVLDANDLFLAAMGYGLGEVRGRHHSMFVDSDHARSDEYRTFWADLAAGRHRTGEYRRLGKDGRPVWLQATYNLIFDMGGRPFKIVKYATVVTDVKLRQADYQWQVSAIHKSHAVIAFDLHGIILDANDLFLDAVGYELDEIVGRHHRMFVEPSYAHGAEYDAFWKGLARGQHQVGQYKRRGRDGCEVWLQATYNPVFGMDGKPFKVVKYATVVTEERLRQAEQQGQITAIHKAQCVISFDLDGTVVDANDNFLDAMDYRLGDVRGRHHRMFVGLDEAESADYRAFWAALATGRHQSGEFRRFGRDGREIWLQATYNPIFDMSGRPFRVIKYAIDVTAEKLRRADVESQLAAIRKSQGVVTFALDGTILDVNDVMLATLGYEVDELRGLHHSVLVEADERASPDYAAFWEQLRGGAFTSGLYNRIGKNGREVWIQATYNPILDPAGRPTRIIKFASDVTSQVALAAAYEDAKRQAQHDPATALPNRVRLASFMASALAEPDARLVVLYIDLDRFKPINDTFGHAVGDRVLGEVADRLRRALSKNQLVARVGGDEFVVVAPDLADEAIEPFCQRLIAAATAPIRHDTGDLQVGLSVGIAVAPNDGRAPDDLLRCADAALYRSKQAGRGVSSFYSAAISDRILAYRNAVDDMRRAIDEGEFFLEYQPRFEAQTRRVRSFEALVRWQHPQRGRIDPADFIPLAEKSGLVAQLGLWVLRTACRAATTWDGVGVSVNVSPVQFRSGNLAVVVRSVLTEEGLLPQQLELEITEGVLLENAELAYSTLSALKALGVKLAMDDFGTGYSSLSTLRNFPFDVIKIDRQFIADLDERRGGREVVQAILGLGRALGLSVTAEGVETERQLRALVSDDCDEVQGYLLGRPMAGENVADLLRAVPTETSAHRDLATARRRSLIGPHRVVQGGDKAGHWSASDLLTRAEESPASG